MTRKSHRFQNRLATCETLEPRRLLCSLHLPSQEVVELRPDLVNSGSRASDPADIVWTNRATTTSGGAGDTDHFGAAFGTSAPVARAVVDAVISSYEQMIGSFNYPTAGQHFSLSLSMNVASGFGAGATSGNTLGGKPITGSVSIGNGNNTADPNDDNGWFLDPTPTESSEFTGNIVNAFAGDAPSGSPAHNKFDFYTITLLELTHCMGQFGNTYPAFGNLTTNTTINDGVLVGKLWVFRGPSIKHLLTSDNAGNTDTLNAIHSAETQSATFAGDSYVGTEDSGNAIFEFNRRYLVDNVHALMFKDAFGYSTINPASQGTMYSVYNQTNKSLLIRGGDFASGHLPSSDLISISSTATTLTVTVDIGSDVAGSGALPGEGDLPSFITQYPVSSLDSITVQAGSGDDVIFINSLPSGCSMSIEAGSGNDLVSVGSGDFATNIKSNVTVAGGLGTDTLGLDDSSAAASSNSYVLTNGTFSKVGATALSYSSVSNFNIFSTAHTDLVTLGGAGAPVNWNGGAGDDTFNIGNGVIDEQTFSAPIAVQGGTGNDIVRVESQSDLLPGSYVIGNTAVSKGGVSLASFSACESLTFNGGGNDDTVDLNLTPGSIPMTLNGNQGDDTFDLNVTQIESAPPAKVINGGFGNDTVVMNNSAITTIDVSTITNNTLTVFSGPSINYGTVESLIWNCLTTASKNIFVLSTATGTSTKINGSSGSELIRIGGLPNLGGVGLLDPILGAVTFDGNGGTDTISMNDHAAVAANTYVLNGNTFSRTGAATVSFADTENVDINAGSGADVIDVADHPLGVVVTVDGRAGLDTVSVNSDGVGSATAQFVATQDLAALNIGTGGTAVLTAGSSKLINTRALSIAGAGKLDLNDNDMIVDYTGAAQLANVQALINSARNNGSWNGNGITSTSAKNAPAHNTTLGAVEATEFKSIYGNSAPFDGQSIDNTAVLVKYTYYGDTDLNGVVNFDDYSRTDAGFNGNKSGWLNGDFDGNGVVNFDDYALIDLAFNTQGSALRPGLSPLGSRSGKGEGMAAR